ncbi:MAG: type ISP restriction/modification enzyme, partial [Planktothrix sp.]
KPVFDALFDGYAFTEQNPVSQAMQKMLDVLEGESLEKDTAKLENFYSSVRERARGIDNAEAKQKIIIELYDKFFRSAFPQVVERLGIVYTPVEVVDFIVKSADQVLREEFGLGLTDEGVNILDPFTGTGTFIVRLLQNGLIKPKDLERKFKRELHANEIVLLAYYIAAINIEETYHSLQKEDYQPFEGIVLTDTFQVFEKEGTLLDMMFPENNKRVINQKSRDITVIVGNPPYSAGQRSANDNNQNLKYKHLDERLSSTYIENSSKKGGKSKAYDSYIRAIRWASDRIKDKGIVCFVTNGSFLDSNSADGLRKCLVDDFTSIYYFNLRGNIRKFNKSEGENIFGQASMTPVSIILLVKNSDKIKTSQVLYYDIGDSLKRVEKLNIIKGFSDISNIQWQEITPNDSYDWINQRNDIFESFISLGDKKDKSGKTIFDVYSMGVKTSRDTWAYNFSKKELSKNIQKTIDFYNQERDRFFEAKSENSNLQIEKFIRYDATFITWDTRRLKGGLEKNKVIKFDANDFRLSVYRPFCKQYLYFNHDLVHSRYSQPNFFPNPKLENLVICVTGAGVTKDFNALIVNTIPDMQLQANGQCFPLYAYEKQSNLGELFATANTEEYVRKENTPNSILKEYQKVYKDKAITKEDIFYYVYGVLHSPEYKQRFASDLKKMLPCIPYCEDFWAFSNAGKELAHWHINYETIEPYPLYEVKELLYLDDTDYRVKKMVFGKRNKDKTTIVYNSKLTLQGIPLEAYDYIVNGKPALDWIMERYQVTKDKKSGITNDPNDWSDDPRYIVDLVKRVVRVSVETVKIVNSLPPLNELN